MIRNEICCDICGFKVADIRKGLLGNKIIVYRSYAEIPSVLLNGKRPKVHICSNCMKDFVHKVLEEQKEQSE